MKQLAFYQSPPRADALPLRERPVHRVAEAPTACNVIELLSALVGGPRQIETAEALLARYGSLRAIRMASASEIAASVHGIGQQTAARLVSALELGRRLAVEVEDERPLIHSPADAANIFAGRMAGLSQEEMHVLLLDTRNRVQRAVVVYRGNVNASMIRMSELFADAVRDNAPSIILAHNHPSGDPTPSREDLDVTGRLSEAGKIIGIEVLDHIIIGEGAYYSFADEGKM